MTVGSLLEAFSQLQRAGNRSNLSESIGNASLETLHELMRMLRTQHVDIMGISNGSVIPSTAQSVPSLNVVLNNSSASMAAPAPFLAPVLAPNVAKSASTAQQPPPQPSRSDATQAALRQTLTMMTLMSASSDSESDLTAAGINR